METWLEYGLKCGGGLLVALMLALVFELAAGKAIEKHTPSGKEIPGQGFVKDDEKRP